MKKHIVKCLAFVLVLALLFSGCTVRIKTINVEEIPNVNVGETHRIVCTVEPENATDKTLWFESSDESVATVDEQGVITALAPGDVDILVYPANSDKNSKRDMKSAVTVNVAIIQPVTSIECEAEVKAFIGEAKQLEFNVLPENASDKTLEYKSLDEAILTVDNEGVVTGIKTGEAVVTATSVNGVTAECKVLVREYATDMKLDSDSVSITAGSSKTVKANLLPEGADGEVSYSSSNTSVAAVDGNGKVTAKAKGKATITVTVNTENGNSFSKSYTVNVTAKKASTSSSNSSSNKNSNSSSKPVKLDPSKIWESRCPFCYGRGYTSSGNPCFQCDYWEKHGY